MNKEISVTVNYSVTVVCYNCRNYASDVGQKSMRVDGNRENGKKIKKEPTVSSSLQDVHSFDNKDPETVNWSK